MQSINVAHVLQKAGDADWSACPRSQVYVEYIIILYTFTFIRLPHLYKQFYVYCIFITNGGGDGIGAGWLIFNRVLEEGQWVGIIF